MIQTFAGPNREQLSAIAAVENSAYFSLQSELLNAFNRIAEQAQTLVRREDIDGILELSVGLGNTLQRPIMAAWEQGYLMGQSHGIFEMQLAVPARLRPAPATQFALSDDIKAAIAQLFQFTPQTFRNLPAERAIQRRVLRLAGNFAKDTLKGVKADLLAAVVPQPDTGNPISRQQLNDRLVRRLNVSTVRARMISRTETTNSYNQGRVKTFDSSSLVTHLLFVSISDHRRSEICKTREGMVIPKSDKQAIARNTPSLHVGCRSVLSPLLSINARHQALIEKPNALYSDRTLAPLPKGWRTGP